MNYQFLTPEDQAALLTEQARQLELRHFELVTGAANGTYTHDTSAEAAKALAGRDAVLAEIEKLPGLTQEDPIEQAAQDLARQMKVQARAEQIVAEEKVKQPDDALSAQDVSPEP